MAIILRTDFMFGSPVRIRPIVGQIKEHDPPKDLLRQTLQQVQCSIKYFFSTGAEKNSSKFEHNFEEELHDNW